jgi:hypothetical protein
MPNIAVINRSSVWTDAQAGAVMDALQFQLDDQVTPIWDVRATLHFFGAGTGAIPADWWWLTLLDTTDDAAALGYHEMTADGLPIGKVFLQTTVADGGVPSVTASHELLEMLVDPWLTLCVSDNSTQPPGLYAYEICDACEGDGFAYEITTPSGHRVMVSDFVYPAWFEGWRPPNDQIQFDYMRRITAPFQLLPGGYISFLGMSGGGWQQLTGDSVHHSAYRAHVGTRRERRQLPKDFWRKSTAHTGQS